MKQHAWEIVRYVINGVAATTVHFAALYSGLTILHLPSAGLANLVAALFGISASFLGSRYFVFPETGESILRQACKFSGLYGAIALLHGLVLFVWSDRLEFDYRIGFLLATVLQVSLSYVGNKFIVFKALKA